MAEPLSLASYEADRWQLSAPGPELRSAIDDSIVAHLPGTQPDVVRMLAHARDVGGPALRALTFQERGRILRGLAEAVVARKEELCSLSHLTGATVADSALDIEGGAGTLFVYSRKARALPDGQFCWRATARGSRGEIFSVSTC